MDLANYLKFLLYNNDSVIIPGLGTLITKYKHAEINTSEKTISPPSKYLQFEFHFGSDDLLIRHIAQANQIEMSQASDELKKIISDFIHKLDQGETVLLEGIGYFSKENNILRFEKEQDANFLTESYGLTKLDYEPVELHVPYTAPLIDFKPKKKHTALVLTSLFLLIAGGSAFLYVKKPSLFNFLPRTASQSPVKPIVIAEETDSIQTDTSQIDTAKTVADTSGRKTDIEEFFESTVDKKNALSIPASKKEENYKYYIIAGSFKTHKKAEELAKQIEKDGYKIKIIEFKQSIFRISLGEYTDKEKAVSELNKIRNDKGDNTVWLLSVAPEKK